MIRLFRALDTITLLSSTPDDLHAAATGITVDGADVTVLSVSFDDTFNLVGNIVTGTNDIRTDVNTVVVSNAADSGATPRIQIVETVADVAITLFNAILPPGYSATMQGDGNTFVVAPTGAAPTTAGVTKIIAGTNTTIDQVGGEGDVTVNAADASAEGALMADQNLSDLTGVAAAQANLELSGAAISNDYLDLGNLPELGSAAAQDTTFFASAAQGTTADAAVVGAGTVVSGRLALFSGTTGKALSQSAAAPGTAAFVDTSTLATAAQGTKADSAMQLTAFYDRADVAFGLQALTNTTDFTLTAAQLVNQLIDFTGAPAGDVGATLPNATDILAVLPAAKVGDTFQFFVGAASFGGHQVLLKVNTGVTFWPSKWGAGNPYGIGANNIQVFRGVVTGIGGGAAVRVMVGPKSDFS